MSGHTKGPWKIGTSCDRTPAIIVDVPACEGSGFVVAHINRLPIMGSVSGNADANARLIAAAPDLLAALEDIDFAIGNGTDDDGWNVACEKVRAAIAKAKGEQALLVPGAKVGERV